MTDTNPISNNDLLTGEIRISPRSGQVFVNEAIVRLGPVNMAVLCALVSRSQHVVSRSDLFSLVWPNQDINDDVLTRCIADLRKEIGQHYNEPIIETIPKRGYRWCLPQQGNTPSKTSTSWFKARPFVVATLLLIVTFSLFGMLSQRFLGDWFDPDVVPIALLPINSGNMDEVNLAIEIENDLREQLGAHEALRFISTTAMEQVGDKPIPALAEEFSTRWIVESVIRPQANKFYIEINLVDARTALVEYSTKDTVTSQPQEWQSITDTFVNNTLALILPTAESSSQILNESETVD